MLKTYINYLKRCYIFLHIYYCGGKIRQSILGPSTRTKPNHDKGKDMGLGYLNPTMLGRTCLGRPRRSTSSDSPSECPTHTLYMVKSHPIRRNGA